MSSSSHIPSDIELEIMKRLPAKSLIRFMSACKAWKSLINCSEFVSGYMRASPAKLIFEFRKEKETFEGNYVSFADDDTFPQQKLALTSPPLLQLLDKPTMIGTSCGLFCFYGLLRKPNDYNNNQTGMFVLWNPSIRKSVGVVAMPNWVNQPPFEYDVGFGVCPSTKDPKLVKIIRTYPLCKVMVFTLSSKGGGWRRLSNNRRPLRESIRFESDQRKVIGGFIYWLALDRGNGYRKLIMSFDLSTDEFKEVDLPDGLRQSTFVISTLRESLALLVYKFSPTEVCDVWMMMGNGDRKAFTKLYTIEDVLCVGFRKSGEPIIRWRYGLPGELIVYEPCSGHTKYFEIPGTGCSYRVYSYMESLLLLDHDDGHIVNMKCGDMKT